MSNNQDKDSSKRTKTNFRLSLNSKQQSRENKQDFELVHHPPSLLAQNNTTLNLPSILPLDQASISADEGTPAAIIDISEFAANEAPTLYSDLNLESSNSGKKLTSFEQRRAVVAHHFTHMCKQSDRCLWKDAISLIEKHLCLLPQNLSRAHASFVKEIALFQEGSECDGKQHKMKPR